jgi:acetone carboxylase gamma subunit
MNNSDRVRCENLTCLCEVPLGDTACSSHCSSPDGRDPHVLRCECGHSGCAEQNARQLGGEAGKESL